MTSENVKKVKFVVVLYEKKLSESATLESLKYLEGCFAEIDIQLIIFDNTLASNYSEKYFEEYPDFFNLTYFHTPENKPLRDIYNLIIDGLDSNEMVVWLDDDTDLACGYLREAVRAFNQYPNIDLFVPRIYVNNSLYSPYFSFLFFGRKLTQKPMGTIRAKNIGAINSGMAVRSDFFLRSNFKYPSIVEFYGTDKIFCDFHISKKDSLYVLDVEFEHDVNFHPSNNSDEKYFTSLVKVDLFWRKYYRGNKLIFAFYCMYIFIYCMLTAVKRKDLTFLKIPFAGNKNE